MQLYKLDFPNGKSYIGITSRTASKRFNEHCCNSVKKNPCQNAIQKYGKENVVLTVLATVDNWELLCLAECEAIEKFNTFKPNGYNITLGGDGCLTVGIYGDERVIRDKESAKLSRKKWKENNKDILMAGKKRYRENNREKAKQASKAYRELHKTELAKKRKIRRENKTRNSNPLLPDNFRAAFFM